MFEENQRQRFRGMVPHDHPYLKQTESLGQTGKFRVHTRPPSLLLPTACFGVGEPPETALRLSNLLGLKEVTENHCTHGYSYYRERTQMKISQGEKCLGQKYQLQSSHRPFPAESRCVTFPAPMSDSVDKTLPAGETC